MRSAASFEARLCEELWRIPFQLLGQEPILACTSKGVKEARRDRIVADHKGGERLAEACPPSPCRTLPCSGRVLERGLMQGPTVCSQCDLPEDRCTCERYCTICKGQEGVRLCADGLYYCPDCREACDVSLASSRDH